MRIPERGLDPEESSGASRPAAPTTCPGATDAPGPRSAVRGAFGELDPSQLEGDTFQGLLAMAAGGGLPARMAEINEALNALPVPLRDKLLVEELNQLYRHREDG